MDDNYEFSRMKMLIVEDNIDHQDLIIWSMKEHYPNVEITIAETGQDCIDFCSEYSFDLILLDYSLPEMNGIEVLKELAKKKIITPVILITGMGNEKIAVEAMKLGAYDYIGKIGAYYETLPVVVQQNMEKFHVKKEKEQLQAMLEEKNKELVRLNKTLNHVAVTDELTNLYNYRFLFNRLTFELKRARRYDEPLSCIIIDVDYFKSVNDTFGHQFGDYALKEAANVLIESSRETNIVARYGGDEFLIILPNTDRKGTASIANRIRANLEGHSFVYGGSNTKLTVSIGSATFPLDTASCDAAKIIKMADVALYRAKLEGRNRVKLYDEISDYYMWEDSTSLEKLKKAVDEFSLEAKQKILNYLQNIVINSVENEIGSLSHSSNVDALATKLAREVGLSEGEIDTLSTASRLHDIGFVGIKNTIIDKSNTLSSEEFAIVKKHPLMATDILKRTNIFIKEIPIVLHHHEHFDGTGYPYGMKGAKIPLGARIVAIADAYDAMVSGRIYKDKLPAQEAKSELLINAGSQFDPILTNTFIRIISN